jgi:hypothetical protein
MAEIQKKTAARATNKKAGNRKKTPSPGASKNAGRPKDTAPKAAAKKAAGRKKSTSRGASKKIARKEQVSAEERYRMIQEAAYFRAEKEGFNGDPWKCWLVAEAEIDALLAGPSPD